jgi:beta-glucanase (GH16 family)
VNRSTAHPATLGVAVLTSLLALTPPASAQSPEIPGWRLVWADEFQGTALDAARWNAESVAWPYNNELEYYLPQQATVQGGVLNIRAERRSFGGRNYVSARINTLGHFSQQYGRFEARMMLPAGQGYWPAFWLLPASQAWPPELDIMELVGSQPSTVYLTQHWGTSANVMSNGTTYTGPDDTTAYHRFAIEWSPTRIDWLVDGVVRFSTTSNIPQEPMYVLLNLAVGGNLPGNPTAATVFPKSMLVDWVRVYLRDSALINPGFEDAGAGTPLAGWQAFGNAQQSTSLPHSGAKCVRFFGIPGGGPYYSGVFQDLPASPGQVWSASVFAEHAAASRLVAGNQVFLKIEWNNSAGQQISFQQTLALSDTSPTDTPIPTSMQATAPAGTATARVTLILVQTGTGSGSAFLDDVTFGYTFPARVAPCIADFNGVDGANVQDVFEFLAAWFASDPRADFNEQGGITVQDIFAFLTFWFRGCP